MKKRKVSPESREKMRQAHLGKKLSPETREKISRSHKKIFHPQLRRGQPVGFKFSIESRLKKSDANAYQWKGENVGYHALHGWISKKLGKPRDCANCHRTDRKRYEWANISKTYRRDLSDYIRLCTSCHRLFDYGKITLNI